MDQVKKLIEANDLISAEERIEQLILLQPNNAELYFLKGKIQYKRKEWDKALKMFSIVNSFDPNDQSTLVYIGLIYENKGDIESARDKYKEILKIDQNQKYALEGMQRINKLPRKTSINLERLNKGELMYEWSPTKSSKIIYLYYSFICFIPSLITILIILMGEYGIAFVIGFLSTIFLFYSIWFLITGVRMTRSNYKVYENAVELKSYEGFSIISNIITMYDIDKLELKSDFPLSITDNAYISIPYFSDSTGKIQTYKLFTCEDFNKTKEIFDFITFRKYEERQRVNTLNR